MKTLEGWSALDAADKDPSPEAQEQVLEIYKAVKRIQTTADGKVLFDFLRHKTIEAPTFAPGIPYAAEVGFMREGENNIYRWLVRCVNRASRPEKKGAPNVNT